MSIDPNDIIKVADLARRTGAGAFDSLVGVDESSKKAVRFPASALPLGAETRAALSRQDAEIDAIKFGQGSGMPGYATRAELPTPPPDGQALAFVWKDPVPESNGGWGWNGTAWEKAEDRASGLEEKISAEVIAREAVMSPMRVAGFRFAIGDAGAAVFGIRDDGTTVIGGLETARLLGLLRLQMASGACLDTSLPPGYVWGVSDADTQIAVGVREDGGLEVGSLTAKTVVVERLVLSKPKPRPFSNFVAGLMHVILYGQSVSTGIGAAPILTSAQRFGALRFNGGALAQYGGGTVAANHASLLPLNLPNPVVTGNGTSYEVPVCGLTDAVYELVISENGLKAADLSVLASAPGEGAQSIASLSKGGTYYQQLLDDVIYGYARAQEQGRTYGVMGVGWAQGETDQTLGTSAATYLAALAQLQNDINNDVSMILGEAVSIPWFLYQFNSWINRTPNNAYPTIPLALQQAARSLTNTYLACPTYMLDYVDQAHLNGTSSKVMGAYFGLAQKRVVLDGRSNFEPLWVKSHRTQGKVCTLRLNPIGRLVADTSAVANPGNFGFSLIDNAGSQIPITRVSVAVDTVTIVATTSIAAGSKLRYAFIGGAPGLLPGRTTGPRGNIRDSQGDEIIFDSEGVNWPMHNWLVPFEINIK